MTRSTQSPRLRRFIGVYGTANAGAFIAFVPLLTLILPLKVEQIEPENKLFILSIIMCLGAIAASLSNIAAGWISDKSFRRRQSRIAQIAVGLLLVLISYFVFWRAETWPGILAAILFFQLSFNLLFSPLGALLTDHIPDVKKGWTAAILNLGMPIATISIAVLALPLFASEANRLITIAAIITILIGPLLIFGRSVEPATAAAETNQTILSRTRNLKMDLIWAWIGRFAVQFSGAVIFGYILYYLQDVVRYANQFPSQYVDQGVGKLALIATPIAVFFGIMAGIWSDRMGRRKPFLILAASAVSIAMFGMAIWPTWAVALAGYVAFSVGLTAYLTIDAALVAQILSHSSQRARILGYINLTNTIPAILTPALAILLSRGGLQNLALTSLMLAAAVLALIGSFSVSRIRTVA